MSRRYEETQEYFDELRHQARREVNRGGWEAALATCDRAIRWAEEFGDRDARDLALCNRASILVNQGHGEDVIMPLRKILLSSANPDICYQAAINISRFHDHRKEDQRCLFYARLSLDHARRTEKPVPIARCYNHLGVQLVRQSYFKGARECYNKALSELRSEDDIDAAIIVFNLGYCDVMLAVRGRSGHFSVLGRFLASARRDGQVCV